MKKLFILALIGLSACKGGAGKSPEKDTVNIPRDTVVKIDSLINNAPDTIKAKDAP